MEQVVDLRGLIRRIGWVIKILEAQVGHFILGCKCPVSPGIVVEEDLSGELPVKFSLKYLSIPATEMDNTPL